MSSPDLPPPPAGMDKEKWEAGLRWEAMTPEQKAETAHSWASRDMTTWLSDDEFDEYLDDLQQAIEYATVFVCVRGRASINHIIMELRDNHLLPAHGVNPLDMMGELLMRLSYSDHLDVRVSSDGDGIEFVKREYI